MAKLGSISFLAGVLALAVVVIAAIGILNGYTSGGTATLNEKTVEETKGSVSEATLGDTEVTSEFVGITKDYNTGKLSEAFLVKKSTKKQKDTAKLVAEKPGEPTRPGMKSPVDWCIRDAVQQCVGGGEKQQPPEKVEQPKKEKAVKAVNALTIATEESDDEITDYELAFIEVSPDEEPEVYAMGGYKEIDMYSVSDCVRAAVFGCLSNYGKTPEGRKRLSA